MEKKFRLLLLLALLMTAATGAWAQATYSVKMKDGTVDAKNWSIASGEKSAKGDAADGLTGLSEKDAVTLTYTGRRKVKGVKATSDAAAASVPDGAISGVFSVSSTKKVYFSKGNLRYASSKWSFFDNQYDYYADYSADAWDKFGWSTSAPTYGMNTSAYSSDYSGDFVDWGATMGAGWFTLTVDEWVYLFTRTVNGGTGSGKSFTMGQSVNGTLGVVFYPDNYTGEVYSGSDWATFESAGCVFLPATGLRQEKWVSNAGSNGYYWSATPEGTGWAYYVYFDSGFLNPASNDGRFNGCSVRLVREVATTDAPAAKEPATVTTAPTATTGDIAVGSEKALVSGGAATGGTMMYAVTTANTKPTSTEGFSDAVPTAKTLAAGTYYVWYYVKADASHTDSEISATAIAVTVKAATITVTINKSDWGSSGNSFTKDGVTVSAGSIDRSDGNLMSGGTFSTTLGNFTKIVVTCESCEASGAGWSGSRESQTWAGTPASSVSFSGNFGGRGGQITIVCTIQPTN